MVLDLLGGILLHAFIWIVKRLLDKQMVLDLLGGIHLCLTSYWIQAAGLMLMAH